MKTIIAGSRSINDFSFVEKSIERSGFRITEVFSGRAYGVDRLGEEWGRQNGILIRYFPADWAHYGKRAGYLRNEEMADNAEALIAIWDGISRGTKHMILVAKRKKLDVFTVMLEVRR